MQKYTLAEARARKKITQRELSDASGLTESTIANLEIGRHFNPTIRTVAALARALDIDPAQLQFTDKLYFPSQTE